VYLDKNRSVIKAVHLVGPGNKHTMIWVFFICLKRRIESVRLI